MGQRCTLEFIKEMQLFLRNNVMEFDKVLSGLWKVEPQELVYRY
jgi:hypothetical protein